MKTALVLTLGCKTNQYEGDALRDELGRLGYRPTEDGAAPDVAVVNTCTVTVRADRKCRQLIRRIAREHPGVPIYVTGCYVARRPEALADLDGITGLSADRGALLAMIARDTHARHDSDGTRIAPTRRTRALLKIQDGCDAFCSYCIVPHVRPTLCSEPLEAVLAEARRLVDAGFREIVLTGIHLGRYGADRDDGIDLAEAVRRLACTEGLARLRLSSVEMPKVADDLIELIAQSPVICPHLHLPLQSGDDEVLAAMNRRYTSGDFLAALRRIRASIPDISITTDVIAGFPGETDRAFENTISVCREARFSKMHVFGFSARPSTAAATLPGRLSPRVITERKKRLISLGDELALRYKQRFVGKVVNVLVEETEAVGGEQFLTGLTEHYMRVRFPGDGNLRNTLVGVSIESVTPQAMEGTLPLDLQRTGTTMLRGGAHDPAHGAEEKTPCH